MPEDNSEEAKDRSLLIVDDDHIFLKQVSRAMERRGFSVRAAATLEEAVQAARSAPPAYAVLDIKLGDGNGLDMVPVLRGLREDVRIVMLTGYGNIAGAVSAIKEGAVDYLAKPADADDLTAALLTPEGQHPPAPENPMSADRVRWEHIQRIYELCDHNVSETARRLNMHRRTLQRILAKRSPQ